MFIRFAQTARDPACRVAPGVFHAFRRLLPYDGDDWRHREISRLSGWFDQHLERPETLARRVGRHGMRRGVCWFRDGANDHVSQARYLAWLLGEIGIPIRELRSGHPGTVIFGDDFQIVAVPDRHALVTVH